MSIEKENNIIMDPKGYHQGNQEPLQGHNPSHGFYVPPQPPPAYEMGQPNYQYPQSQPHIVQRKIKHFFMSCANNSMNITYRCYCNACCGTESQFNTMSLLSSTCCY